MRVFLDEDVPRKLAPFLMGHGIETVVSMGWGGVKNGALLASIEREGFEHLFLSIIPCSASIKQSGADSSPFRLCLRSTGPWLGRMSKRSPPLLLSRNPAPSQKSIAVCSCGRNPEHLERFSSLATCANCPRATVRLTDVAILRMRERKASDALLSLRAASSRHSWICERQAEFISSPDRCLLAKAFMALHTRLASVAQPTRNAS